MSTLKTFMDTLPKDFVIFLAICMVSNLVIQSDVRVPLLYKVFLGAALFCLILLAYPVLVELQEKGRGL